MDSAYGTIKASANPEGDLIPTKQQLLTRHSLFGDELLNFDSAEFEDGDDWRDVFDEENPSTTESGDENTGTHIASRPTSMTLDLAMKEGSSRQRRTSTSFLGIGTGEQGATTKADVGYFDEARQSSSDVNGGNVKGRPGRFSGAWHDAAMDKPHREKMIHAIAQLLLARKKQPMSNEKWVARVKAQTRAFESQLYKNAASLEVYKDTKTLKTRLARLADAFTSYFREAKGKNGLTQNSTATGAGLPNTQSQDTLINNIYLRQSSMQSASSTSSRVVEPPILRREQSMPVSLPTLPGPLPVSLTRAHSDFFQAGSSLNPSVGRSSGGGGTMLSSISGRHSMEDLMRRNMPDGLGMSQQSPANPQQLQQQILQLQQQMALSRQISLGQGSNDMMTSQAPIMGNGHEMMMLGQMPQNNSMNLNMVQHQNFMQQQQQQQQGSIGINMMQNSHAGLMAGNNIMNINLQNLMQGVNMDNGIMNSRDSSIPQLRMPSGQGLNDGNGSDMLPGPFNW